jgi:hypothetical protein
VIIERNLENLRTDFDSSRRELEQKLREIEQRLDRIESLIDQQKYVTRSPESDGRADDSDFESCCRHINHAAPCCRPVDQREPSIASHVVSMSIIQDRPIVPTRAAGTPIIPHLVAWLSMVLNGGLASWISGDGADTYFGGSSTTASTRSSSASQTRPPLDCPKNETRK